jgi:hypothetical protein
MLRRQRVFDWVGGGGGGGGGGVVVEGFFICASYGVFPQTIWIESLLSFGKTVSKHVMENCFKTFQIMDIQYITTLNLHLHEAAKNIRFSHSNLFWGASIATLILPFFLLPQHVLKWFVRKIGGSGVLPQNVYIFCAHAINDLQHFWNFMEHPQG